MPGARGQRQKDRVIGTKPSLAVDAYAGTYGGDLYGDATVAVENGALVLRLTPNPDMVADLTHWHYDTFLIKWRTPFPWWGDGWVQFLMDNRGKVTELKLDVPNDDFWFWEPEFRKKKAVTRYWPSRRASPRRAIARRIRLTSAAY
jgi:hypothetical protein